MYKAAQRGMIEALRDLYNSMPELEKDARFKAFLSRANFHVGELGQRIEELSELATIDKLTRLYNFAAYKERLEAEADRALRTGEPLALIMLDLDKFKPINDTYGHAAGNEVLAYVGEVMRKHVRRSDTPCRIGGDEFAIILPGTRIDDAKCVAERIKDDAGRWSYEFGGIKLGPVEFSQGIAGMPTGFEAEQYLEAANALARNADRALYDAKRNGRNRICVYVEPEEAPDGGGEQRL